MFDKRSKKQIFGDYTMSENIAAETNIQQNSIDLLSHQNVGYIYLSPKECLKLRDGKLNEVILKDILISQLQKINGFEYKGNRGCSYSFPNTRNYSSRNKNVLVHVYVLFRLLNRVYFKTKEVNKLIYFLLI